MTFQCYVEKANGTGNLRRKYLLNCTVSVRYHVDAIAWTRLTCPSPFYISGLFRAERGDELGLSDPSLDLSPANNYVV